MAKQAHAAYSNQLHDLSTVEKLDAANRVRELEGHPGWTLIRGLIEVQTERLTSQMTNASLPSYEQMAALAGEIRGLRAMAAAAETVLAVAEEAEREAEQEVHSHGDAG